MNENEILEEATFYLQSNKTLKEVAIDLGISKRTLQLHIKQLEQINKKMYDEIRIKQEKNQVEGRIKGASIGKRSVTYTKEQANYIAVEIATKQLTYNEASKIFDIPSSTIYEMVHSDYINQELRLKLDNAAAANTHKLTVEEYNEQIINESRIY